MLLVNAVLWTATSDSPVDGIDAWLWLIAFTLYEMDVLGAREERDRPGAAALPLAA